MNFCNFRIFVFCKLFVAQISRKRNEGFPYFQSCKKILHFKVLNLGINKHIWGMFLLSLHGKKMLYVKEFEIKLKLLR